MKIRENVPISELTTMRLGGAARYVLEIESVEDVLEAYNFAKKHGLPIWVMGGGANTIGRDEGFSGVIFLNKIADISMDLQSELGMQAWKLPFGDEIALAPEDAREDDLLALVGGGMRWDEFVAQTCEKGYSGVEALTDIPGTVGAAPVQNIGAYGQDVAGVIEWVYAFDLREGEMVRLDKSQLGMGYRRSRFNTGEDVGRYFIIYVSMRLRKDTLRPPFYNSLQRYIDEHGVTDFSPMSIRKMVHEIRGEKLPDPKKVASAGSFFKNVRVAPEEVEEVKARGIPVWVNEDGSGKLNSGWLIEQCGLKGKELYGMRVSDKAALVLINEKARTYADLAKARQEIIDTVREKFGFVLEQEPVEIYHGTNNSTAGDK